MEPGTLQNTAIELAISSSASFLVTFGGKERGERGGGELKARANAQVYKSVLILYSIRITEEPIQGSFRNGENLKSF